MTEEISIKVSRQLLELSGLSKEDLEHQNHLLILFELYQQGKISISKSAELAGMKVDKFLEEFRKRRLLRSGGPTSSKEAEKEFQSAKNLLK
jgi:predicted HTH domain antitoxin